MRKTESRTGTGRRAAMLLLAALFFVLPAVAPAMSAGPSCHDMGMALRMTVAAASAAPSMAITDMADDGIMTGRHHARCGHHHPGQPCPDGIHCGFLCMGQCGASLAVFPGVATSVFMAVPGALARPASETAPSYQDRLSTPPPRG